jgi:hypothetical protein
MLQLEQADDGILGSVWIEWLQCGRVKAPQAMRALYEERSIEPESESVSYCHRSARSTNAYDVLRYAGSLHRELLATAHTLQDRYCKPYISLPATGMRAIRISPDSASVM